MCIICLAEDRLDKEAEEVYEWMVENESPDKQVFFNLGEDLSQKWKRER
jgi:hypothetical protein